MNLKEKLSELVSACEELFANEELIAESEDKLVISVHRDDYREIMRILTEVDNESD